MIAPNLKGVARTLLVPLACRAIESMRPDAILRDPRAVEAYHALGGNPDFLLGMGKWDQIFTVMRTRQFDKFARDFICRNSAGLVVDIGCGLDTRFDRLDDGRLTWLGVDLREVIELRHKVLHNGGRCKTIGQSMFELSWLDEVARINKPVTFLAEGVFSYFGEADVKLVLTALADRFDGGELVFDALSSASARIHNRIHSVLKETGTSVNWWVDDPSALEGWGLHPLDGWGYFDEPEPRLGLANLIRYIPPIANSNCVLRYRLKCNC